MGAIKPVMVDFSMGELSPKIATSLYAKGASKMTNVVPWTLGGCGKRGGLEHQLIIDELGSGSCRMIPWSISNEIDILILLFDGYIKFLDVSGGALPSFIQDVYGDDILISQLDDGGEAAPVVQAYSAGDIDSVQYAQSLNMIILVHKKYPPFYIKAAYELDSSTSVFGITLSYGLAAIMGNLATTKFVDVLDTVYADMSGETILNALSSLARTNEDPTETITFTSATEGLDSKMMVAGVEKEITSITIARTSTYDTVTISGTINRTITELSGAGLFVNSVSGRNIGSYIDDRTHYGSFGNAKHTDYCLVGMIGTIPASYTGAQGMVWCRNNLRAGSNYVITRLDSGWENDAYGKDTTDRFVFNAAKTTYVITLAYSGGTLVISSSDDTGEWVHAGYINIPSQKIAINGYAVEVVDMVDRLAPWMIEGKVYGCSAEYKLNGEAPINAIKSIKNGEPGVELHFEVQDPLVLSRASLAKFSGQVGVNLAPMGAPGEYPSVVSFHQGRCCMGGSEKDPNVVYMSKVNDYFNFAYFEEIEYIQTAMKPKDEWTDQDTPEYATNTNTIQQTGASSAILLVIATDENEAIQSLVAQDDLFVGTATSEWIFPAGLTALNPRVSLVSRYGSASLQSRFVRDAIMFVGSAKKNVRAFGSPGADLMQYAEHIAKAGIVSFDFRQEPYNEMYLVLSDGTAIVGRLSTQGVAWFRVKTVEGDTIESVACIRASDEDAAYFIVKRSLGAGFIRTIERMKTTDDDTFTGRFYLDGSSVVAGPATSFVATRMVGEVISIRGITSLGVEFSGTAVASATVSTFVDDADSASKAIPQFSSLIWGKKYTAVLETMRLDTPDTEGFSKKAETAFFRCYQTGPFNVVVKHPGSMTAVPDDSFAITPPDYDGVVQYPFTGMIKFENLSAWETDQKIRLESDDSVPFGIHLIIPQYQTGDSL